MSPGSMNQRLARSFLIDCFAASMMGPPLVAQMAAAGQFSKPEPSNPTARTLRRIDGWTVRVDDRQHALRFLDCNFADIRDVVAAESLAKLQSLRRVQAQRRRRWDAPVRRLPRSPLHAHRPEGNLRRDVGVLFGLKRFFSLQPGKVGDGCTGGLRTDASDMGPVADKTAVPSRKSGHRRREFIGLGEVAPATTGNLLPTDREDAK